MNHKRKKCKNSRGGCLLCKPWKMNGARKSGWEVNIRHDERQLIDQEQQLKGLKLEDFYDDYEEMISCYIDASLEDLYYEDVGFNCSNVKWIYK